MLATILLVACLFAIASVLSTLHVFEHEYEQLYNKGTLTSQLPWTPSKSSVLLRKQDKHQRPQPRVYFMDHHHFAPTQHRVLSDDPTLHAPPGEEAVPQDRFQHQPDPDCVPIADWQTRSYPNCNVFHEMNLHQAMEDNYNSNVSLDEAAPNAVEDKKTTKKTTTTTTTTPLPPKTAEDRIEFLAQGWFRSTWRWDNAQEDAVVLKMLRLEREFFDEYYELHRKDAVAMERLSSSPFVMDIYGYCGQSALNELADFPNGLNSLEKFDRNLRNREGPEVNILKLHIATSVAVGLAHVHEIDDRPSMVHYDMNPRNVAIVRGGKPKLNDFNIAEFLQYNPTTNETCGFRSRLHEPWWRAPEEVQVDHNTNLLTEKVDVYSLGNLLFHILTTRSPHGKMKRERMEEVRPQVLRGEVPVLAPYFAEHTDPAIVVLRKAMYMCYEPDPLERPSAREVANMLLDELLLLKEQQAKKKVKAGTHKGTSGKHGSRHGHH